MVSTVNTGLVLLAAVDSWSVQFGSLLPALYLFFFLLGGYLKQIFILFLREAQEVCINSGNRIISAVKVFMWCQVFPKGLGVGILGREKKL